MRSEIIKSNQIFLSQLKNNFDLQDLESVEMNKEAMVNFTKRKLRNWIFIEYYNYFEKTPLIVTLSEIDSFIDGYRIIISDNMIVPIEIGFFHHVLTSELNYLTITKDSPSNFKTKIDYFKEFLVEIKSNFNLIDTLNSDIQHFTIDKSGFDQLFNNRIKGFLDLEELYNRINNLFDKLDKCYFMSLMNFDKQYYIKNYKNGEHAFFDFEEHKNPVVLREYPKDNETYHKAFKTAIVMHLEYRKKVLGWNNFPDEYRQVYEYAESLTNTRNSKQSPNDIPNLIIGDQGDDDNYPKHIFLNKKAFLLFETLNKKMTTHVQLSFLYRIMAEKDNLIVVKDTPFRNWYNNQEYKLQLEYNTKTLEQSKSDDRMTMYNVVKSLIFNE
ncbi:hypothetical protein [Flavobacterium sp. UBA6135]|uniref:hypothetical protein n=1 Tax=Flavobacterium sp. UBA6135 TaxID=1946553 RepID=UPI0025B8F379|nr:hypothetical protein [Flavobacterium sp. UBA6135]